MDLKGVYQCRLGKKWYTLKHWKTSMKLLNNVCMEESNDPVDGDKYKRQICVLDCQIPKRVFVTLL